MNYHGAPLAIQQKGVAFSHYIHDGNFHLEDYTVLEQKTGLRSSELRDVETLTPLVTDTVERESANGKHFAADMPATTVIEQPETDKSTRCSGCVWTT